MGWCDHLSCDPHHAFTTELAEIKAGACVARSLSAKLTQLFRDEIHDLVLIKPVLYPTELTSAVCTGVSVLFAMADNKNKVCNTPDTGGIFI